MCEKCGCSYSIVNIGSGQKENPCCITLPENFLSRFSRFSIFINTNWSNCDWFLPYILTFSMMRSNFNSIFVHIQHNSEVKRKMRWFLYGNKIQCHDNSVPDILQTKTFILIAKAHHHTCFFVLSQHFSTCIN